MFFSFNNIYLYTSFFVQIVFEGIRGTGHEGDIAVDDIKLLGIDCITKESFQECKWKLMSVCSTTINI